MLLKSLHYFWMKASGMADPRGVTRISGETYWRYRIHAETVLFLTGYAALFGSLFLCAPPELPLPNRIGLACVFAVIGGLEWLRLRIQLREQREFAHLFYG